jgi:hypothetical protein
LGITQHGNELDFDARLFDRRKHGVPAMLGPDFGQVFQKCLREPMADAGRLAGCICRLTRLPRNLNSALGYSSLSIPSFILFHVCATRSAARQSGLANCAPSPLARTGITTTPHRTASSAAGDSCVGYGVNGRPIRACAEPMPKTIPSSAAPNITIRPASIVNLNSLSIALLPLFVGRSRRSPQRA